MRILTFTLSLALCGTAFADQPFKVPGHADDLLVNYCYDCHGDGIHKGGIQLDNLAELTKGQRLDLLNTALEMVYTKEMPPSKGDQPDEEERAKLSEWMWGELKIQDDVRLEDKMRYYKYANYLDHDKLFSGKYVEPAYSPARRWRINELIYHERIKDVFEIKNLRREISFFGIVKPFNLPQVAGVRYYDTEMVESGQFLTLLSNAKWIVDKQLRTGLLESGDYKHPQDYQDLLDKKLEKEEVKKVIAKYPDERWQLKRTSQAFKDLIMGKPTDEALKGAIVQQFKLALQREPSEAETLKYIGFMKKTMADSDKVSALKKMMVGVLMEPEFVYRSELGGGAEDEHGRKKLTSREASYAIAYALTDKIPDPMLTKAAEADELTTREQYENHVRRLLADPGIKKPRILRFFRDYFGYENIYNVFKDEERFIGHYNPHRAFSRLYLYRVPGAVSGEADTLVKWALKRDTDVFETLLTTDRFFVNHNGNNEEMIAKAAKATASKELKRKIYIDTKGMDKKQVVAYVYKLKGRADLSSFKWFKRDGKNLNSRFYGEKEEWPRIFGEDGSKAKGEVGMPHPGGVGGHYVKMWNIDNNTWDYPAKQPFKVENRMGMLTHPAWLVSNSQNAATDPIHRGKWIQEKLLGGIVRDVPITVDAKVPEDPHKTLRGRFAVTESKKCWHCHEKMNPLGYPFESYDDFGRFRTEEEIEYPTNVVDVVKVRAPGPNGPPREYDQKIYKTQPVDPTGYLKGTGDEALDGPVKNAEDLISRLAKSDRVRQVFIRNVFRYFMGRNETLADSQTLINADKAYLESGGSFNELIVSILTSDSFIYRK